MCLDHVWIVWATPGPYLDPVHTSGACLNPFCLGRVDSRTCLPGLFVWTLSVQTLSLDPVCLDPAKKTIRLTAHPDIDRSRPPGGTAVPWPGHLCAHVYAP